MESKKKKSPIKAGIGYSPLTERVYWGKQNQEKRMWVGDKQDITSDFIRTMFEYIPENTSRGIVGGPHTNIFFNIKDDKQSIEKTIKFLQKRLEK